MHFTLSYRFPIKIGWLECHPDKFNHDPHSKDAINIMGRNSFITGFGGLTNPISKKATEKPGGGSRVCLSSEYSIENFMMRLVKFSSFSSLTKNFSRKCKNHRCMTDVDNPSLKNNLCKSFKDNAVGTLGDDTAFVLLDQIGSPDKV